MNTYGRTACPKCGAYNNMYRPLSTIKLVKNWDLVNCWNCKFDYKHTDKINSVKTEAEQVRESGRL